MSKESFISNYSKLNLTLTLSNLIGDDLDGSSRVPGRICEMGNASLVTLEPELVPVAQAFLQDLDWHLIHVLEIKFQLNMSCLVHVDVVAVLQVDPDKEKKL